MRISDILECIEKIERYTQGYNFIDFQEILENYTLSCAIWASLGSSQSRSQRSYPALS